MNMNNMYVYTDFIRINGIKFKSKYLSYFGCRLIYEFLSSEYIDASSTSNKRMLSSIFYNRQIIGFDDFNDDTYYKDFFSFSKVCSIRERFCINRFYIFLIRNNIGNFNEITELLLSYNGSFKAITNGFRMIIYDKLIPVPETNKWLLECDSRVYKFDFSGCNTIYVLNALKNYIWIYPGIDLSTKCRHLSRQIEFLNSLKYENDKLLVSAKDILTYKNNVLNSVNKQSAAIYLSNIKTLIKFLEAIDCININPLLYKLFYLSEIRSKGNATAYTKNEIEQLLNYFDMNSKSAETSYLKVQYRLMYIILYITVHSSMRLESVLNLKIDSVHESAKNCYYVIVDSKIIKNDKYNITKKIKDLIFEAIEITSMYRTTQKNLFIVKRTRSKAVNNIIRSDINNYLSLACKECSISYLGITGIRNRFMQDITKHSIDTGADKALINEVSKHSINVHYKYYLEKNIDDICLDMYGVYIGDIKLNGKVLKDDTSISNKNDIVQNGCGYCNVPSCYESSCLDCLMCKNFITTPNNAPYFLDEINKIDEQIIKETIRHEKEFLITKKRLYLKYYVECIKKKEEIYDK